MEPKDLILFKGKLKEEYAAICKTEFWKDYVARIEGEKKLAISHCLTDSAEKVPQYQGAVRAIATIEGLPDKVLSVAPRKNP